MRTTRRPTGVLLASVLTILVTGCAPTTNLSNPTTPHFSGSYAKSPVDTAPGSPIRVVTFNIQFARRIERAITVLQSDSLRGADILTLQEIDDTGVDRIARALGLNYVYYPSAIHPNTRNYYGPALLSRWPIERSWKLLLPHLGRFRHQQRTATAAVVRVRGRCMRVYAVHLETQFRISETARQEQIFGVLSDASTFEGPVVIAGDFNSQGIGPFLVRHGYRWLTETVGPSAAFFSWDHIFVRNLRPGRPINAGVMRNVQGASDHRPVWAVVVSDVGEPPTTALCQ